MDLRELLTTRSPHFLQRCIRATLRCLSWPYYLFVTVRNLGFEYRIWQVHQSDLPVISVGNLSVGGTGKSPTVAWIARWLREREIRVAILSRGYGQLDSGQNDEALELELQLPDVPHLQHWDRVASARLAEEELQMQVLLLDDGFQHRRMARDLDIVLLDASEPPPARRLLPGGLLREPLASLRRADVIMLTRVDQALPHELSELCQRIQRTAPNAKLIQARHHPHNLLCYPDERQTLDQLQGKKVLAFCAIGNPPSFFRSLKSLGAELLDHRTWPDHHAYTSNDVEALVEWTTQFSQVDQLVCTVKDWVKLQSRQIGNVPLVALTIELDIVQGQGMLEEVLEQVLQHDI